jgi:hypothetical protein
LAAIGDSVNVSLTPLVITVADSLEISDAVTVQRFTGIFFVNVADGVTIVDTLTRIYINPLKATSVDLVAVSDIISASATAIVFTVDVVDLLTLTDGVTLEIPIVELFGELVDRESFITTLLSLESGITVLVDISGATSLVNENV